jgi:hypothetical protein
MITPENQEIILEAINSALIDVHTALPGVVEKYDATKKVVEVVIQTKRMLEKEDGTFTSEELPKLTNVPIANIGSSGFGIGIALAPGDEGWIMFSETSLDQWRTKGTVTSPSDIERHGLSGAVFLPMPISIQKLITDVLTVGAFFGAFGGAQVRATGSTVEVTTGGSPTASGFVATATLVAVELGKIATAITGLGGAYTPGPVASTNLKAD